MSKVRPKERMIYHCPLAECPLIIRIILGLSSAVMTRIDVIGIHLTFPCSL